MIKYLLPKNMLKENGLETGQKSQLIVKTPSQIEPISKVAFGKRDICNIEDLNPVFKKLIPPIICLHDAQPVVNLVQVMSDIEKGKEVCPQKRQNALEYLEQIIMRHQYPSRLKTA